MIILGLILARSAGASVAAAITGDHSRAGSVSAVAEPWPARRGRRHRPRRTGCDDQPASAAHGDRGGRERGDGHDRHQRRAGCGHHAATRPPAGTDPG